MVAACCVAETESVALLTALLEGVTDRALREVLRELAADEVRHARLGWAWLAHETARGSTAFLAPLVPAMLEGSASPGLFSPPAADGAEDAALLASGVLPPTARREVFVRALEEVVLPGLEAFDMDVSPARAWLAARSTQR